MPLQSCLVAALRLDPACWDAAVGCMLFRWDSVNKHLQTLLSQIYHQAGDLEASVKVMRAHLAASNTADAQVQHLLSYCRWFMLGAVRIGQGVSGNF